MSQCSEMEKWEMCLENFPNPVCFGKQFPTKAADQLA